MVEEFEKSYENILPPETIAKGAKWYEIALMSAFEEGRTLGAAEAFDKGFLEGQKDGGESGYAAGAAERSEEVAKAIEKKYQGTWVAEAAAIARSPRQDLSDK